MKDSSKLSSAFPQSEFQSQVDGVSGSSSADLPLEGFPKYLHVAERIRSSVKSMPIGTKLPPLRSLAKHYGVSLSTVLAATSYLESERLLRRQHGSGVFVNRTDAIHHIRFFGSSSFSYHTELKTIGMRNGCRERGWQFSTRTVDATKPDLPSNYLTNNPNGIIIASDVLEIHPDLYETAREKDIPIVVLGRESGRLRIESVTGDDFHGMSLLLRHLQKLGHRKIALLVSEPEVYEIRQRIDGFQRLAELFEFESKEVFNFHIPPGDLAVQVVAEEFRKLLRKKQKPSFTAVVACSDPGAMALIRVFHEFGIRVPQDCAVAGFDDELFANYLVPSLTNLCWHMEEWGEKCLQVLERIYENKPKDPIEIKIKPTLNIRESTGMPVT